jgi:hypothetical protein
MAAEGLEGYDPLGRADAARGGGRLPALATGKGSDRLPLVLRRAWCSAQASRRPLLACAARRSCERTFPTGMLAHHVRPARGGRARRPSVTCHPRLVVWAIQTGIWAEARRHEPARDGDPGAERWRPGPSPDVSMGAITGGDVPLLGLADEDDPRPIRAGEQGAQVVRALRSACSCSSTRSCGTRGTGAVDPPRGAAGSRPVPAAPIRLGGGGQASRADSLVNQSAVTYFDTAGSGPARPRNERGLARST